MSFRGELQSEVGLFTITSNMTTNLNDYAYFVARTNNISSSSITNDSINLPAGNYYATGIIACQRSSSTDYMDYQFEADGTLIGSKGGLNTPGKTLCDDAKCQFELTSPGSLKLKIINESSSTSWTPKPDYSYILIIRSF